MGPEDEIMSALRYDLYRLEVALTIEDVAERQPLVGSICSRMRSLLREIEESSGGRTV